MKRKMFYRFAAICIAVMSFTGLNAQTRTTIAAQDATVNSAVSPDVVSPNSTHKYAVDFTTRGVNKNVYTWSIELSNASWTDLGPASSGTDYNMVAGAQPSLQNITWLKAGYYIVTLTEANPVSAGSCTDATGLPKTMNVQVISGTIQFASTTGVTQCPAPATSYSPALTITGTVAYPLTITYSETINGTTTTGHTYSLTISGPLVIPGGDSFLDNTTQTDDVTRKVQITGVVDKFGGVVTIVTLGGVDTNTSTIWALPQTTPISHD